MYFEVGVCLFSKMYFDCLFFSFAGNHDGSCVTHDFVHCRHRRPSRADGPATVCAARRRRPSENQPNPKNDMSRLRKRRSTFSASIYFANYRMLIGYKSWPNFLAIRLQAQFIAQSIGQAFQVAYMEFLKANGIEDHSFVKEMDYQEVLNSQEIFGDELQMFAKKELQKEVNFGVLQKKRIQNVVLIC